MPLIRVGDTIHREAKAKAAAEGVTLLSVVEKALRTYVDHAPPAKAPAERPLPRGRRTKTPAHRAAEERYILLVAGACLSCKHGLEQHIARKGSRSKFCQHAGCACRIQ